MRLSGRSSTPTPTTVCPRARSLRERFSWRALHLSSSLVVLGLMATATPAAHAAEYDVSPSGSDSNPGTESFPWRQISRANATVVDGDTVKVAPGNHNGGFTTSVNGKATARITCVSTTRWGARINVDPNPIGQKKDHGWKNTGEYVTIDGFEIDGTAENTWRFGIYSSGNHGLITRNHVHHIADEYPECSSAGGAGIEGDNWYIPEDVVDNIDLTDNLLHHIGPFAKAPCNYYQGIYLIAGGKIKNNIIYKVVSWGMTSWHDAGNNDIVNNVVTDCGSGGIALGAGGSGATSTSGDYFIDIGAYATIQSRDDDSPWDEEEGHPEGIDKRDSSDLEERAFLGVPRKVAVYRPDRTSDHGPCPDAHGPPPEAHAATAWLGKALRAIRCSSTAELRSRRGPLGGASCPPLGVSSRSST